MSKIFVIAGNYQQARDWIKTNLIARSKTAEANITLSDYLIVTGANSLLGIRDAHGVFYGTWRERKDLEVIFVTLLHSTDITSNSHRVINRIWSEWKEGK